MRTSLRNRLILILSALVATVALSVSCNDAKNSSQGSDGDGDGDGDSDGDGDGDGDAEEDLKPDLGDYPPIDILALNMIDDLEDGDTELINQGGRSGAWYVYNDGTKTGKQTPVAKEFKLADSGAHKSSYSVHTTGSGFTEWGAGIGFDLRNLSNVCNGDVPSEHYNAEVFNGVAFMAKGNGIIRIKIPIPAVLPVDQGGTCTKDCENAHGRYIKLTNQWHQYQVKFKDMIQDEGWGASFDFNAAELLAIEFEVLEKVDFDFYIDDIAFFGDNDVTNETLYPTETNNGPSDRSKLTGFRASRYGIDPFPNAEYWTGVGNDMASYVDNGKAAGLWIVGQSMDSGDCALEMTKPSGGSYTNITFASSDPNEAALDYFDKNNVKIILQVEPSDASVDELMDIVLNEYSGHSSVIGFGVDIEFYQNLSNPKGKAVTDEVAEGWLDKVKSFNSDYILMLKHFDPYKLPPCSRNDMLFVNDSQNNTKDAIMAEFTKWANFFTPGDVGFQIGYDSDKSWWSDYSTPPADLSVELQNAYKNTAAIFWVDFTVDDVFPGAN